MQHKQATPRCEFSERFISSMFVPSVCTILLLFLPRWTSPSCTEGTANQCKHAEFAPGTNLAGEGFDITTMERKGAFVINTMMWQKKDKTCTLCTNPFLKGKKQKLPLSVVNWRPNYSCSRSVSSKLHQSSESLVSSSASSVENNWKVNLDVDAGARGGSLMLAGTHSKLAEYSMDKTKGDKFSFTSQSMSCEYYSYGVRSRPKLHTEFHAAVKKLPKAYSPESKQHFYKLIDNFGTHYITKVKLGGRVESVTSIKQCQASLQGFSTQEVQMCLEAEASVTVGAKVETSAKHCKNDVEKTESKSAFSSLFSDRTYDIQGGHNTDVDLLFSADKNPSAYKEWLNSLPQNPGVVSYSLDSLHELLPFNNPARKNLRRAISHYILEKGLWKNCSNPCQVGVKSDPRDTCVCQCHNDNAVNQDCCPVRKGMARVIITVQRGSGLWGDYITTTDGFVKVFFKGQMVQRTPIIINNNDPHWDTVVDLGSQDLTSGKNVKFEVWDQDNGWDDELLGACQQDLKAGVKEDLCALDHGTLFYKIEVTCAPSLSGELCTVYKPSPMNKSLQSVYVSRHTRPVPKAMLLEMGVFVDDSCVQGNHNFTAKGQKCDEM
ncbi:perforin-1-like [Thalassophryne amazonica]|uniref:perforin-1-like n=1 Tax=Thalassophryne amazonica TaxID=390379 RepID=UPI0014716514|nr:perforin-1-like [Thalassophryne amazonica]